MVKKYEPYLTFSTKLVFLKISPEIIGPNTNAIGIFTKSEKYHLISKTIMYANIGSKYPVTKFFTCQKMDFIIIGLSQLKASVAFANEFRPNEIKKHKLARTNKT